MLNLLAKFIFWLYGWKVGPDVPKEANRCVMIASPHTSNWDFVFARAAFQILGIPVKYTVKKEFVRFPFKSLMLYLGAIAIDRSPRKPGEKRASQTDAMIRLFEDNDELAVMVTPEGTRSLRTEWKTGFYYVAKGGDVPICFGYLDYKKKIAGVGGFLHPSGDMDADLSKIMAFYKDIQGKFPEKFSTDLRYTEMKETNE
ncbi:MAG: 1-acyl-sn-glycerol-3-phosphate acyltransferase [Bacteroidota bacterium]